MTRDKIVEILQRRLSDWPLVREIANDLVVEMLLEHNQRCEPSEKQLRGLGTTVDSLGLSTRAYNTLYDYAGLRFVRDIVKHTDRELLKTKNFGRKSLDEVKQVLWREYDLKPGMLLKFPEPGSVPDEPRDTDEDDVGARIRAGEE